MAIRSQADTYGAPPASGRGKTPLDAYRRLAQAVLIQCFADLNARDDRVSLDALAWLLSPACQLLMESTALDQRDPVDVLSTGGYSTVSGRIKGRAGSVSS